MSERANGDGCTTSAVIAFTVLRSALLGETFLHEAIHPSPQIVEERVFYTKKKGLAYFRCRNWKKICRVVWKMC